MGARLIWSYLIDGFLGLFILAIVLNELRARHPRPARAKPYDWEAEGDFQGPRHVRVFR
jgi:hypothetical protein